MAPAAAAATDSLQNGRSGGDASGSKARTHDVVAAIAQLTQDGCGQQAQSHACHTLWKLACNAEHSMVIADNGGIQALLRVVDTRENESDAQAMACGALCNVGAYAASRLVINQQRGVRAMVQAMHVHAGKCADVVVAKACAALCNLTLDQAGQDAMMNDCDGVQAIMLAMHTHKDNADIQATACHILRNLATSDAGKHRIVTRGGIQGIVCALKHHTSDVAVVQECLGALQGIVSSDSTDRGIISEVDGIHAVVSVIQAHASNVDVLKAAFRLLYSLSFHIRNKKTLVARCKGALEAIVRGMNEHMDDIHVQHNGLGILWNVCTTNDSSMKAVSKTQYIQTMVASMVAHRSVSAVHRQGCGVLSSLARKNEGNQNAIREHKGIVTIICAIRLHMECCLVARNGCCALWNLSCSNHENAKAICRFKGVSPTILIMNRACLRPLICADAHPLFMAWFRTLSSHSLLSMGHTYFAFRQQSSARSHQEKNKDRAPHHVLLSARRIHSKCKGPEVLLLCILVAPSHKLLLEHLVARMRVRPERRATCDFSSTS